MIEEESTRICNRCGEEKPIDQFYRLPGNAGWRMRYCKTCRQKQITEHRKNNMEAARERVRKHREKNRDEMNTRRRELRARNPEAAREKDRAYYRDSIEKAKKRQKRYLQKNKEKIAERAKKYRESHSEYIKALRAAHRERQNQLDRERRRNDPRWRLNRTLSNYIYQTIKGRKLGQHWEHLVGFTVDALIRHLEKQFQPGMTWDNYGEWHIDHIIPIAAFNFNAPGQDDFQKCWNLKNLRPMWAKENIVKGSKVLRPFQPSLAMSFSEVAA